jgi:large repetitive protein
MPAFHRNRCKFEVPHFSTDLKSKVHVILFVVSALAAQAQVSICNGTYNLVTTMAEPDCNGGQGQVNIQIQGYSGTNAGISWADGAASGVFTRQLPKGTFQFTVWISFQAGCDSETNGYTTTVTVTEPSKVKPNAILKSYPSCDPSQSPSGPDGILEVSPSGGTTNNFLYKVDWDPIPSSPSFTSGAYQRLGTGPGTYYVAVRDDKNCEDIDTVFMPSGIPQPLSLTRTIIQPDCAGQLGDMSLAVNGPNSTSVQYSLINPTNVADTIRSNLTGVFNDLDEGNYLASVTNQDGCTVQDNSIQITAPNPLQYSVVDATDVRCYGESDASVTISISGGTKNYSAYFNDLSHNQISSLSQMNMSGASLKYLALQRSFPSGDYYSYLIDAGGCMSDSSYFTISEPVAVNTATALSISETKTNACLLGRNSGELSIQGTGGYPAYEYAIWNGNQTTNQRYWELGNYISAWGNGNGTNSTGIFENNLSPGTYTIGVKDQYGCQRRKLVTIGTQSAMTVSQQALTNVDCNANSTGSITVSASGGLAPLTYELLPAGTQQSTPTFTGLSAGPYQVKVIDDYGCESSPLSFDISEPDVLVASITYLENPSCNPGDGRIGYTITGGTLNYQIMLNGVVSQTISALKSSYLQSVAQGPYTFQVKDANGCESTLENFTISGPPSPGAPANNTGLSISEVNYQHVSCPSGTNGFVQISIQGGWPATGGYTIEVETVSTYVDRLGNTRTNATPFRTTNNTLIDNLPSGNYRVRVKDSYGCSRTLMRAIIQPDPIVPNFNGISGNCSGSSSSTQTNGGVTLNGITGGTPPYEYTMNGTFSTDIPNFFPNLNLSGVNMVIWDDNNCVRYYP